ncbi:unnamed protein product [Sphagnum tenellum]
MFQQGSPNATSRYDGSVIWLCIEPHQSCQAEDAIQRPVSTAAPKWASDGNEPESNDITWAPAVSYQINTHPSPSRMAVHDHRMAVHDHTSIDDVVCEVLFSHRCRDTTLQWS